MDIITSALKTLSRSSSAIISCELNDCALKEEYLLMAGQFAFIIKEDPSKNQDPIQSMSTSFEIHKRKK